MPAVHRDVLGAIRLFRSAPGFALLAILMVAVGSGANAAFLGLLDALAFRPLPVHQPDRLVAISAIDRRNQESGIPLQALVELGQDSSSFVNTFGYIGTGIATTEVNGTLARTTIDAIAGDYYGVLGVSPYIGRVFDARDADPTQPGSPPLVVIGYDFWQARFGGDPNVLGSVLRVEGVPFTIIGVTPPTFFGLRVGTIADLTVPVAMLPRILGLPPDYLPRLPLNYVFARLRDGISIVQAATSIGARWSGILTAAAPPGLGAQQLQEYASARPLVVSGATGVSRVRARYEQPLYLLIGSTIVVLLVTCANLSGLMLVRVAARQHELAVRVSLGASRWQVARSLLTESLVLSLLGSLLGLLVAWSATTFGLRALASELPGLPADATPHWRVFLATSLTAVGAGLAIGAIPAVMLTRRELIAPTRQRHSTLNTRRGPVRWLLVAQLSCSLVIVLVAGLFVTSLFKLQRSDPGFRTDNVIVLPLAPQPGGYNDFRPAVYYRELLEGIASIAGVDAVAVSDAMPVTGLATARKQTVTSLSGTASVQDQLFASTLWVTPDFFRAYRIDVLSGRGFDWSEDTQRGQSAVISASLARRLFPHGQWLGQRIELVAGATRASREIIGVVRDARYHDIRDAQPLMVFLPALQAQHVRGLVLHVRTMGNPEPHALDISRRVESLGREYAPTATLAADLVDASLVRERLIAILSVTLGLVALFLVVIGVYGLLAFSVTQATSEIGIRLALGAIPSGIFAMMLFRYAHILGVGVAVGVPAALGTARLVESLLFEIGGYDVFVLGGVVLLLSAVTICAAYFPARHAARLTPVQALRHE